MSHLDRQIRAAQHRLWLNHWLHAASVCGAIALALLALAVAVQRSYDLAWPMAWLSLSLAGLATIGSIVWMILTRDGEDVAAARLDHAAGLRERLSSGRYCSRVDDPFARAVVADAERVSASISARRHIPLTVPKPLPWTFSSAAVAGLMFLIAPGWLKPVEELRAEETAVRIEQTKDEVDKKLEPLKRLAEVNPVLEQMREDIDGLDKHTGGRLRRPDDIRHEAVKKIDKLSDAVRQRRDDDKYENVREMRKLLRQVKPGEAPTDKLAQALANGDFKAAEEEIAKVKEQLATLKHDEDKETVKKVSEQLQRIADQIKEAAKDDRLAEAMKKAGVSEEDAKRILESLSKKDLEQLKKELADKGVDEQQAGKLAKQLKQKQSGADGAKQLAQKLGQAAAAAANGQTGDAQSALSQGGRQLSELEQLEQEMGELDAALAALDDAKGDVSEGDGNGDGDKPGLGGMGQEGRGRGGIAPQEQTDVRFKTERGKVAVGKGGIAGQFLVEGEQVPGKVGASVSEVVTAAERDASDRIKRDRIPRQYQPAVKAYFSNVQQSIKELKPQPEPATEPSAPADETPPKTEKD